MLRKKQLNIFMMVVFLVVFGASGATAQDASPVEPLVPIGSAFTYQGRL